MHISCLAIMTDRRVKWTANLAMWTHLGQWPAVLFSSLDCIYVLINQCIRVLKLLMQSIILCLWVSKTLRQKHLAHSKLSAVNSYVTAHKEGGHLHFSLHKAHSEIVVIIFLTCKFINPSSPSVGDHTLVYVVTSHNTLGQFVYGVSQPWPSCPSHPFVPWTNGTP